MKYVCAFNKVFIRAWDLTAPKYIIINISNLHHIRRCLVNVALEFIIVSDCHLLDACILHKQRPLLVHRCRVRRKMTLNTRVSNQAIADVTLLLLQ